MKHRRHTFATDMVRAGISLPALMQLMGHADIETTMHYVQVSPQDVYLSKYDSAGNLQWTQLLGSSGSASGYSLALNPQGGVVHVALRLS